MIDTIDELLTRRDVSQGHRDQVAACVRRFAADCGNDLSAFNDRTVNAWLAQLVAANGRSPRTLQSYRACLLNAWRMAHLAGHVDVAPGVIRKIRAKPQPPVALTLEELRRFVAASEDIVSGRVARALILLTWDTGLRPCDACDVDLDKLAPDGVWRLVQRKTGVPHAVHIRSDAQCALRALGGSVPRRSRSGWCSLFRRLRAASGVSRGSAQWLRRSAASYVEAERPGAGQRFLGHVVGGVAGQHYFDPSITGRVIDGPSLSLREE